MKKAMHSQQVSALALALILLAGCNSEDPISEETFPEQNNSSRNSAPSIWGDPKTSTLVGAQYLFQPEASDSDGDILEFAIANKPDWAEFDPDTGTLQGYATAEHVGQKTDIVISVTDQDSVVSLPSFVIVVNEAPVAEEEDEEPASSPPVISGEPNRSAVVDSLYSFQPDASDADGDKLSFSIVSKPEWATFDTTTGRLEGRPNSSDVGTTDGIELSVTDGTSIAALATFSITVEQVGSSSFTVAWSPPTENEDGSPLTDLSGYRIYYGTTSGEYGEEIVLDSPGLSSYVIENLTPGKYFLVMTSTASSGLESAYTPELSFEPGS